MATQEQRDLFYDIAVSGHICGLTSPVEWYSNYIHTVDQVTPYNQLESAIIKASDAMAVFYREACPDGYEGMTNAEVLNHEFAMDEAKGKYIEEYYRKKFEGITITNFVHESSGNR